MKHQIFQRHLRSLLLNCFYPGSEPNFEPSKFLYEVAQLFTLLRALVCQIIYCFYNMVKNWPAKHFGQRICRTCFFRHLGDHSSKHSHLSTYHLHVRTPPGLFILDFVYRRLREGYNISSSFCISNVSPGI